jgi:hypothetical protein
MTVARVSGRSRCGWRSSWKLRVTAGMSGRRRVGRSIDGVPRARGRVHAPHPPGPAVHRPVPRAGGAGRCNAGRADPRRRARVPRRRGAAPTSPGCVVGWSPAPAPRSNTRRPPHPATLMIFDGAVPRGAGSDARRGLARVRTERAARRPVVPAQRPHAHDRALVPPHEVDIADRERRAEVVHRARVAGGTDDQRPGMAALRGCR